MDIDNRINRELNGLANAVTFAVGGGDHNALAAVPITSAANGGYAIDNHNLNISVTTNGIGELAVFDIAKGRVQIKRVLVEIF